MSKISILINSFATLIVRGTTLGVRVLAFILLAKIADQSIFGMLAFLMACTEIFRVIADMGLDNYTIKCISQTQDEKEIDKILSKSMTQKLLSAVLIFLLYFSIFKYSNPEWPAIYISLFGLMAVSPMFLNFSVNFYLAQQKLDKIIVTIIGVTVVILAAFLVFWSQKAVLPALSCVVIGEFFTAAILGYKVFKKHNVLWVSLKRVVNNLHRHYAIGIAMLVAILYSRLDIVFIKYFFQDISLAQYGFAQRITEPALFIVGAFSANSYSLLSRYYMEGMQFFAIRIKKVIALFFCLGVLIVALTIAVSWFVVNHFYQDYLPVLPVIYLLCIAIIFKSVNLSLTSAVLAMGDFKVMTWVSFVNLTLSVIFIYLFLHLFGIFGAALGVIAVESINSCMQAAWVFKRTRLEKNVA
ncbi:oligosaccharide flippase family protein [Yokenella regensburgei]|uniref:oligosaccharide flippase family protein n=1 Tax=Yokenella regensburgei TaxID=158877 RepID=UPI0020776E16|nr:oligosaccharide flippase family protein [Yokenella regensburgei]